MKHLIFPVVFLVLSACQNQGDEPAIDCSSYDLTIRLITVEDANCGLEDGEIIVAADGGDGDYTYEINTGDVSQNGTFNVRSGNYTVSVKDGSSCSANISVRVDNAEGVRISDISQTAAGCDASEGSISITAEEGTPPYNYALNGGEYQSDPIFTSLTAGEYTVNIRDATGCETSDLVYVRNGTSWENEISAIVLANCAIPDCHGGSQLPDFRDFDNVVGNADQIKSRTSDGSMPPNTVLDANVVKAIACWVDDGAPAN